MAKFSILAICGSLRKDSLNKKLLQAFISLAPEDLTIELVDISNLPLFNQDLESKFPQEAADLKAKIRAADGILISTPEYNRSIPGVLKNAIDWASRPYGDNAWDKKPVGLIGASIGNIGTAVAQCHLKSIFGYLNTHIMGQPEFYLNASKVFDPSTGQLTDQSTKDHITKYLTAFQNHLEIFKK